MIDLMRAKGIIEDHGHVTHLDGDRLVAECECVFPDGRVVIEYETFNRASTYGSIEAWLGY